MTSQIMQTLDDFSIPLLIPTQAKALAEQFAAQQPTNHRRRQVYLNTLAVCIVNNYLRIMGIPTNLAAGDSWNPSVRLYADVADLEVVGRGRLECRPLLAQNLNSMACLLPPEVDSRIGYVVVELDLEQELATILGFVERAREVIPLTQLRSPDELLEHLLSSPQTETTASRTVNLRQWLQDAVTTGWETLETLFPPELNPAMRKPEGAVFEKIDIDSVESVLRLLKPDQPEETRAEAASWLGEMNVSNATTINALTELLETTDDEETRWQAALSLGKLDPNHDEAGIVRVKAINIRPKQTTDQVALMVAITPKANNRIGVWLQVQPLGGLDVLPGGLTLKVLSISGETRLQVEARSDSQGRGLDQSIGHRFSPPPGVGFWVQLQLGSMTVTEDFLA